MIRLHDPGLDQGTGKRLHCYQQEVNQAKGYAEQVARAKKLFSQRSSAKNRAFREVRKTLTKMCSGAQRCVYCEDSVGDEVEHIQPKDLYPCVVFVWTNFVYACGRCNGNKSNKYAVFLNNRIIDVTRPRGAKVVAPASGPPVFLNPRVEDPLGFLDLDLGNTFMVVARDGIAHIDRKRAEFTIDTLKLNRDVLLRARATAFGSYRARLYEYVDIRETANLQRLNLLAQTLKSMPHPTIWEEMKRKRAIVCDLDELFSKAPEALGW